MEQIISCCGMVCSECQYYADHTCRGCPELKGDVFWLEYVEDQRCPIYLCCVEEKQLPHCGKCGKQPCAQWTKHDDPTVTQEEALLVQAQQLEMLHTLP